MLKAPSLMHKGATRFVSLPPVREPGTPGLHPLTLCWAIPTQPRLLDEFIFRERPRQMVNKAQFGYAAHPPSDG